MAKKMIFCRICNGQRPVYKGFCQGCATPVANAELKPRARSPNAKPPCPNCHGNSATLDNDGRYVCNACQATYEDVEVYVPAREPKERLGQQRGGRSYTKMRGR